MIKPWRNVSTRQLLETPIFRLSAHERTSETSGKTAEFYVLDFTDWVNVVAITESREMILIEQYRHGTARTTLEIPGGMVDATDESPEVAARRELVEETGYVSDDWTHIGTVEPNPATHSNRCHTFLARNAKKVRDPELDHNEEIELVLEPSERVIALVRAGRIDHALVVAALFWWQLAEAR